MSTPSPAFTRLVVLEAEGSGESEEWGGDAWRSLTLLAVFIFPCTGRPVTDLMNMLPLVRSVSFS